jgi:hypothetical protein
MAEGIQPKRSFWRFGGKVDTTYNWLARSIRRRVAHIGVKSTNTWQNSRPRGVNRELEYRTKITLPF